MASRIRLRKKKSRREGGEQGPASPTSVFQTRAFPTSIQADAKEEEQQQGTRPDLQTQLERADRLGHHVGQFSAFPPTAGIQLKPFAQEDDKEQSLLKGMTEVTEQPIPNNLFSSKPRQQEPATTSLIQRKAAPGTMVIQRDEGGTKAPPQPGQKGFKVSSGIAPENMKDTQDGWFGAPETHPEYPVWVARSKQIAQKNGFDEKKLIALWPQIMKGLQERNQSVFNDIADQIFKLGLMKVSKLGTNIALWTGGIGVSRYAEAQGKDTLESREFYTLTDDLDLISDWSAKELFFNALSAKFASQIKGEVHVYMRDTPGAVLANVEKPSLKGKVVMFYHVLATPDEYQDKEGKRVKKNLDEADASLVECNANGELGKPGEEFTFNSYDQAIAVVVKMRNQKLKESDEYQGQADDKQKKKLYQAELERRNQRRAKEPKRGEEPKPEEQN